MNRSYYQEQKEARKAINDTVLQCAKRGKPLKISAFVFELGLRFALSDGFFFKQIEQLPKVYEFVSIKGDLIYFDVEATEASSINKSVDDLQDAEVVKDD